GVAVRDQRERDAAAPELRQAGEGVGEQTHHRPPPRRVVARDRLREVRRGPAETLEREFDDVLPGPEHVHALAAVTRRVVPEPSPRFGDRRNQHARFQAVRRAARGARLGPAAIDSTRIVEQSIVEVEKQGLHVHPGSSSTTSPLPQPYFFSESFFTARASSGSAFASTTRASAANARRPTRTDTRGSALRLR